VKTDKTPTSSSRLASRKPDVYILSYPTRWSHVSRQKKIEMSINADNYIKYMQNIVKQNSMILLKCILTLFLSTTCFGYSYELSSGWLLFLGKAKYTINNAIVIVTNEISYNIVTWKQSPNFRYPHHNQWL